MILWSMWIFFQGDWVQGSLTPWLDEMVVEDVFVLKVDGTQDLEVFFPEYAIKQSFAF